MLTQIYMNAIKETRLRCGAGLQASGLDIRVEMSGTHAETNLGAADLEVCATTPSPQL